MQIPNLSDPPFLSPFIFGQFTSKIERAWQVFFTTLVSAVRSQPAGVVYGTNAFRLSSDGAPLNFKDATLFIASDTGVVWQNQVVANSQSWVKLGTFNP